MTFLAQAKIAARRAAAEALHFTGISTQIALRSSPTWKILMYHRVTTSLEAGYLLQPGMYVRPKTFERHAAYLAESHNVISLDELTKRLSAGEAIPSKTVCLTFDDGWLDNYTNAFPALKKYKLPATIFLATSFIGGNDTLWTDKVAHALDALRKNGEVVRFSKDIKDHENMPSLVVSPINRLVDQPSTSAVQQSIQEVISALQRLPAAERMDAVNALIKLAERHVELNRQRSFISWDEAREMAANGVTFGCHTHDHKKLTELDDEEVLNQVHLSQQKIMSQELKPSKVFCYPEGAWNTKSQKLLAGEGWKYALGVGKHANLSTEPKLLPRVGIHDDITLTPGMLEFRVWVF